MYFLNQIIGILLTGAFSLLVPGKYISRINISYSQTEITSSFFFQEAQKKRQGYSDVTAYGEGFIAAGTDGRIDWISITGMVTRSESFPGERFNCIVSGDKRIIAAGDRGTILISSEKGIFRKVESHFMENINSLTIFKGIIIAGADNGSVITGDGTESFKKIKLDVKGNIVSVSARQSDCYGVTDEGEIIHSSDGIKWDITDFNKVYSGYYKPCYFKRVVVSENSIVITGVRSDGSPVLLFSSYGSVWA
ncbi:MAG: hypothetical protein QUS12_00860, partial [Methanosarcina sp.]|nr:hypothetical protein [Methanosarcina sp.]